ncbi:MAG: dipeptidase [Gemmatimonadales bacterium]
MRWLRRLFVLLLALALLAALLVVTVVVPIFDGRSNQVRVVPLPPLDSAAARLHRTLAVADLHADQLLWPRDLTERSSRGHVDLPRLVEGRVALQVFSAVTKTPRGLNYERNDSTTDMIRFLSVASRWPRRTWSGRTERALYLAEKFDRAVAESEGGLVPIRSTADLTSLLSRRASNPALVGGLLSIEGAHAAEGTIAGLERLYDAGYRIVGLTHFFDNEVGGSSAGVAQGGLTPFGREAIAWMAERRMIVDLAHASPRLIDEVLATNPRPVMVRTRECRVPVPVRGTSPTTWSGGSRRAAG